MEYTKGEWKVLGKNVILNHPGWSDDKKVIAGCNQWLCNESEANAHRIVKAVNCHDDLVEALREMIKDWNKGIIEIDHKTRGRVIKVLSKAEAL